MPHPKSQGLIARTAHLPSALFTGLLHTIYALVQALIVRLFAPPPPPAQWAGWDGTKGELGVDGGIEKDGEWNECWKGVKPHGRIAVVGAGLTGVSSAAHAIAHGFSPVIFEASPYIDNPDDAKDSGPRVAVQPPIGGIWTHVNSSSGLQLNSLLYRFFPAVRWSCAFPHRDEILAEVRRVWHTYGLAPRTRFGTPVTSVRRAPAAFAAKDGHTRWVVNDGGEGVFDAVIVTVGTCGEPMWAKFPGMPEDYGSVARFEGSAAGEKADDDKDKEGAVGGTESSEGPGQDSGEHDGTDSDNDDNEDDDDANSDNEGDQGDQGDDEEHISKSQKRKQRKRRQLARDNGDGEGDAQSFHTASQNTSKNTAQDQNDDQNGDQNGGAEKDAEKEKTEDAPFERGPVVHSSQLDALPRRLLAGKRVVVIGSGASAVEAVETVLARTEGRDQARCTVLARDDKWIIPRNIVFDTLVAAQPFGREMPLSFLWEAFLARTQYARTPEMLPAHRPLFAGTPVVNDEFLGHIADGRCAYLRCDTLRLTPGGVRVNLRTRESQPGDAGEEGEVGADVVVFATGFEKPRVDFLEGGLFPEGYERPNLYLQNFSTEDWGVLMTNSSYMNAIGTVGHFHIGIYTRILLTLLLDAGARPEKKDMKLWVDNVRFIKRGASGGALGFFTYAELVIWLVLFHLFRLDRLRWGFFILQGWGVHPQAPQKTKSVQA